MGDCGHSLFDASAYIHLKLLFLKNVSAHGARRTIAKILDVVYSVNMSAKFDKLELGAILKELSLPVPSRNVFEDILIYGESSARRISERRGMTRPSTYDHLKLLLKRGFIVGRNVDGKMLYSIRDLRAVEKTLEEKISDLEIKRAAFKDALPELLKKTGGADPKIRFFDGKEGLALLLRDIFWQDAKSIDTFWPYEKMLAVLGKEELEKFNTRRIKEGVHVRSLWTEKLKNTLWAGKDTYVDKRLVPKGFDADMGYSVYGDTVSFVSPEKESYGFIVKSQAFAKLMSAQFEVVWTNSKKFS